jgi:outer membrane protein OmpA-like peptidoglycan-associated protein
MAQDWAADVKKYVTGADDAVIKGIVRYCGIALQKVDSSLVSFSDPAELARVRDNFLKKKCGLTHSDDVLDGHIAAVGEILKGDRTKNRVTVYYLLVDKLGLHHLFVKGAVAGAAVAAPVAAVAAAAAVSKPVAAPTAPVAPVAAPVSQAAPAAPVALAGGLATAGAGAAMASSTAAAPLAHGDVGGKLVRHVPGNDKGGLGWLLWALLGLALLFGLWMLFSRPAATPVADVTPAVDASTTVAAEPAAAPQAAPQGAGIIAEQRDEKPLVKVYFDTGKADVVPAFASEAATMKAYLDGHPGSIIGVSGYNDPRGNAAVNAALSKKRAQAVQAALVAAGVPEASIELIKPEAATDATTSLDEARRVEVYIKA